jgi:hypothetical protein
LVNFETISGLSVTAVSYSLLFEVEGEDVGREDIGGGGGAARIDFC